MPDIDRLIVGFDTALRTLFGTRVGGRTNPGSDVPDALSDPRQRAHAAALMRVNHTGEVCAQALYQGQAMTARNPVAREALEGAAQEELEHLAWTQQRISELGGRTSVLNPVFYVGSFAIGTVAGLLGDRWNLGFLAETEKQVVDHLDGHLRNLPREDARSRAIVQEMRMDEARHATTALQQGAAELPVPARAIMRVASAVMTRLTYWI